MKSTKIRNIPEDIHYSFKLACTTEKKSMNEVLIELMGWYARKKLAKKEE